MNDSDIKISPSLFAPKRVANLPREPIEALKAKILTRYLERLERGSVQAIPSTPKAPAPA